MADGMWFDEPFAPSPQELAAIQRLAEVPDGEPTLIEQGKQE